MCVSFSSTITRYFSLRDDQLSVTGCCLLGYGFKRYQTMLYLDKHPVQKDDTRHAEHSKERDVSDAES